MKALVKQAAGLAERMISLEITHLVMCVTYAVVIANVAGHSVARPADILDCQEFSM